MRVAVTGADGFVGKPLVAALRERGHDVIPFVHRERPGAQAFDLRDEGAVRRAVERSEPQALVHLASISPVAFSHEHPAEVLQANLLGTVHLAEACARLAGFRHFLFASSSETYGPGAGLRAEEAPQRPTSPYAVSKLAAEMHLACLRERRAFPSTVLRLFNTYGRVGDARYVVERTLSQMLQGGRVRLGSPDPVRDFLHVDDHVEAYVTCLDREETKGRAINFCTGRATRIRDLVDLLVPITGFRGEIEWNAFPPRPGDIPHMVGDPTRARALGWRPRIGLEEGLERTVKTWRAEAGSGGAESS